MLFQNFGLGGVGRLEEIANAFRGSNRSREQPVPLLFATLLAALVQGGDREVGLRIKEVVETPLLDAGLFADRIDRHDAVTARPDQIQGCIQQKLFSITRPSHGLIDCLLFSKL